MLTLVNRFVHGRVPSPVILKNFKSMQNYPACKELKIEVFEDIRNIEFVAADGVCIVFIETHLGRFCCTKASHIFEQSKYLVV